MTRSVELPLPQHVVTPGPEAPNTEAQPGAKKDPTQPLSPAADEPPPAAIAAAPDDRETGPSLDLAWLRARTPGNRYWAQAAPTDDVGVAAERADLARKQNELYGKMLSGTGTDEDIEHYFEDRRQTLTDFAEVARVALQEGGDQLSDRDRGLFELALKMDNERIDALPREHADAIARKQLQEKRRAEYKANR